MFDVIRFQNGVENLRAVRAAGYNDATYHDFGVRLPNPIGIAERNHIVHSTGARLHADLVVTRTPNRSRGANSLAIELARERIERLLDEAGLRIFKGAELIASHPEAVAAGLTAQKIQDMWDVQLTRIIAEAAERHASRFRAQADAMLAAETDAKSVSSAVVIPSSAEARMAANVRALQLAGENRVLTFAERAEVMAYTGWGGLSKFFEPRQGAYRLKPLYAKQYAIPGDAHPQAAAATYEYFTPPQLCEVIARVVAPLLPAAENAVGKLIALEPSAGIGRFVEPFSDQAVDWTLVEQNRGQSRLLRTLYPKARVFGETPFESWAVDNAAEAKHAFNLIVANPPYGRFDGGAIDRAFSSEERAEVYFIRRCLSLLAREGVAVFVVPSAIADSDAYKQLRKQMLEQWHVAAIARLPNSVFNVAIMVDVWVCVGRGGAMPVDAEDQYIVEGKYFEKHPEHVLGTLDASGGRYGKGEVKRSEARNPYHMDRLLTLRPIKSMISYNIARAADGEVPVADVKASNRKAPRGTAAAGAGSSTGASQDTVGKAVTLGNSAALSDSPDGARDRLVMTADQRHLARCCMLAEYVPRLRKMAQGNAIEYEQGKAAHTEIASALGSLLVWSRRVPSAMESLRALADEGVVGADLFLKEVVPIGGLFPWPERADGQLQDIAGAAKARFPHGDTVHAIAANLQMDVHALAKELTRSGWFLVPPFAAETIDYTTLRILPDAEFSSGDMAERYASTDRYMRWKSAKATLELPPLETETAVSRSVRADAESIVTAWGQFADEFAAEFAASYERACELAGFEDVETFIAHLEPASLYIAPGVVGAAVSAMLESAGVGIQKPLAVDPICYWRTADRFAVTPGFVGFSRELASQWFERHIASKKSTEFTIEDFQQAEMSTGIFLHPSVIDELGNAIERDDHVADLNLPDKTDSTVGIERDSLAVGETWVLGKVSQKTVKDRLLYGVALYLGNNRRRKVADDDAGADAAEAHRAEIALSINTALAGTPSMPDLAKDWARSMLVSAVVDAQVLLRDRERLKSIKDAKIRQKMASEVEQRLLSFPHRFPTVLKDAQIVTDLSWAGGPEAVVEAVAKLDGLWLAVSPVGNGVLGWPTNEYTGFVESSLHGYEYAAIRHAPDARERAMIEEALGNAMRADLTASESAQSVLRHRLRLYAAPYVRREAPMEMPFLLRWRSGATGVDLLPHQAKGAWQTYNDVGALMAFDVGVGKTYCGTATIVQHRQYAGTRRAAMVLPNPLTYKWCRDFARCTPDYAVAVLGDTFHLVQSKLTGQIEPASKRDSVEDRMQKVRDFEAGLYDVLIMPRSFVSRMYPSLGTIRAFAQRLREEELQVVNSLESQTGRRKKSDADEESSKGAEKRNPQEWLVWTIAIHYLLGIQVRERAEFLGEMVSKFQPVFGEGDAISYTDSDQALFDKAVAIQWQEHQGLGPKRSRVTAEDDAEVDEIDDDSEVEEDGDDDGTYTVPTGLPWDKQAIRHEDIRPDLVVIDEAQAFKNLWFPTQMQAAKVKFLGSAQTSAQSAHLDAWLTRTREFYPCKVQLLSATPAKNSPIELYNMLGYISPRWLRERGLNSVANFASRFLRIGKTLYVKPSGDIESNANAVTAFSDIAALRAILFRFATFLDSDTAAMMLPPEQRGRFAKPRPIPISTDIALTPSERAEVAAMRAVADETGRSPNRINAETLPGNPYSYAEKDGSNTMLALSMLPRVGAQAELSMVARPLYVGTLIYRPDTLTWHTINRRLAFEVGAFGLDDLYDVKRMSLPSAQERRKLIGASIDLFHEFLSSGGSFEQKDTGPAVGKQRFDSEDHLTRWMKFAQARNATMEVSCGWRVLPPRWWWEATTKDEQEYMLRQVTRFQIRAYLPMGPGHNPRESRPEFKWRKIIEDKEDLITGLLKRESGQVTSGGDYQPSPGGVSVVDAYAPMRTMVGSRAEAESLAREVEQPVLFVPSTEPLLKREKRQTTALQSWVSKKSQSTAAARYNDPNAGGDKMSLEAMQRRQASLQYFPMLPDRNKAIVNAVFTRRFNPKSATGENLWKVLGIKPSARITALVDRVKTYAKDKAQIIFCLEKDMQLAIYWALVQAGLDGARIGIMNADTVPTPAEKLEYANAFNGVENRPETATLDIIIANSVAYEGIDLQVRTVAIHHFDLPWEPATLTQRNGRAWRQGNRNPSVDIVFYTAANSSDGYRMQMLEGKSSWITNIVKSEAFVLANPSADAKATREQQFMAQAPDAEAAALIAAKFKENEDRERAMARSAGALRELGRTSRFMVQLRNASLRKLGREAIRALEVQVDNGLLKLEADVAGGALDLPDTVKAMRAGTIVGVVTADSQGRTKPIVVGDVLHITPPESSRRLSFHARVLRLTGDDAITDAVIVDKKGRVRYLNPGRANPFTVTGDASPLEEWLEPIKEAVRDELRARAYGIANVFRLQFWSSAQLLDTPTLTDIGWADCVRYLLRAAIEPSYSSMEKSKYDSYTPPLMQVMRVAASAMAMDSLQSLARKAQTGDWQALSQLPALDENEWKALLKTNMSWPNTTRGTEYGLPGFLSLVQTVRDSWKRSPIGRSPGKGLPPVLPVIWNATGQYGLWWLAEPVDSYRVASLGYVQTGRHDVTLAEMSKSYQPFRPKTVDEALESVTIVPPNVEGFALMLQNMTVFGQLSENLAQYYFGRTLNTYEFRQQAIGSLFRK